MVNHVISTGQALAGYTVSGHLSIYPEFADIEVCPIFWQMKVRMEEMEESISKRNC